MHAQFFKTRLKQHTLHVIHNYYTSYQYTCVVQLRMAIWQKGELFPDLRLTNVQVWTPKETWTTPQRAQKDSWNKPRLP